MEKALHYYSKFRRSTHTCGGCGWHGRGTAMADGDHFELGIDKHCPACGQFYGFVQSKSDYYNSAAFVASRAPGELRISKRLKMSTQRYATMRLEDTSVHEIAKLKGELLVRETPSGTRQLKAHFYETNRIIRSVAFQRWTRDDPAEPCSFVLKGHEIDTLISFIQDIRRVRIPTSGKLTIEPGAMEHPHFTDENLLHAMRGKTDLLREILRTEATLGDVKAWGYRRNSLERFRRLLKDDAFFHEQKEQTPNKSAERVWQDFFEANTWIFGYGLSYIFLGSVDPDRLEKAVAGYSVAWKGSRPDALLQTRGAISALCLVEIKTHTTPLLQARSKRSGAYSAASELIDALSQSQASVMHAERELRESFRPTDASGDPISERIYNYRPRALLVTGRLDEFKSPNGTNEEKYSSFEMLRRNLNTPEIITFDELYERASYIVEHTDET